MKFRYIGSLKNVGALKTPSLKFKPFERQEIKVAIIDDEDFVHEEILRTHKFDITIFSEINGIEQLQAYDVILCDIQGVGVKFSKNYQGAYLMKEIHKRYPFKIIIAYSGLAHSTKYSEYLKVAEFFMKKDASSEEWIEKLDKALSLVSQPEYRWEKIKYYLLEKEVSLFDLALLEDDYVDRILFKKSFDGFPKSKVSKRLNQDAKDILISFASKLTFNLLTI